MSAALDVPVARPLVVRFRPVVDLTDDQFYEFCVLNRDLRIERTAQADVVIMSPAGTRSGNRNAKLVGQLVLWAESDGTGEVFDSSAGFTLPNGAVRAPDAAWVPKARLAQLTTEQQEKFAPLCPDFVAELRSPSDALSEQQEKMEEYLANGSRLGWLIDPLSRRVYVYRPDRAVEELDNPQTLSGEPVLAGFVLDLRKIW